MLVQNMGVFLFECKTQQWATLGRSGVAQRQTYPYIFSLKSLNQFGIRTRVQLFWRGCQYFIPWIEKQSEHCCDKIDGSAIKGNEFPLTLKISVEIWGRSLWLFTSALMASDRKTLLRKSANVISPPTAFELCLAPSACWWQHLSRM